MRVCIVIESCSSRFFTEIGKVKVTSLVRGSARTEEIDFVEIVIAVPSCITIKAGIDAIDKHSTTWNLALKNIVFFAVFNEKVLVICQRNHIAVTLTAFP